MFLKIMISLLILLMIRLPGNDSKFDTLGLFTISNCSSHQQYFCVNAFINAEGLLTDHHVGLHSEDRQVCFLDSQNSEEYVAEIIFRLQEKVLKVSGLCFNNKNTTFELTLDKLPILFTYMSFDMTRLVSYLLVNEANILLVAITTERMYPSDLVFKPTFVYSYESSYGINSQEQLDELLEKFEISYLAILYMKEFKNEVIKKEDCKKKKTTLLSVTIHN